MDKEWYMSKTILAGLALIVKAVLYDAYYVGNLSLAAEEIFMGLGLIGLRQAL